MDSLELNLNQDAIMMEQKKSWLTPVIIALPQELEIQGGGGGGREGTSAGLWES